MHGGDNSFNLEDTLEFDGMSWREVEYGFPGPREGHTLAYDVDHDRTYLFGGVLQEALKSTYYNSTYEWNGHINDWKVIVSLVKPDKRASHVMVFDSWRNASVMYGGAGSEFPNGPLEYYTDTWEWNGTNWTERQTESPPHERIRAAMVFDSRRGVCVMWGGISGSFTNEMWEWDGTQWMQVSQGPVVPSPRRSHAMAYDSDRGVIVLFGGRDASTIYSDTWEYTPCLPDCERDCDLDIFDYLCFLDKFANQSLYCDFERDGDNDLFDFLEFQDAFVNGCG